MQMLLLRALISAFAAVSLAAAAPPIAGAGFTTPTASNPANVNDPAMCAADLAAAINAITAASNAIIEGVAACPPKTSAGSGEDNECASSIIEATAEFALSSQKLASASKTCANTLATEKGANCGEQISASIKSLSASSVCLVASTDSCKTPEEGGSPFGCVVDVVDVVDSLANAAGNIENAATECREAKSKNPAQSYLYDTWVKTGCTSLPSPDWIKWGYWNAEAVDQKVWTAMYDWCMTAKHAKQHHASRLCCGKDTGGCPLVTCALQTTWTGTQQAPAAYKPSRDSRDWPRDLQ